MKEKNSVSSGLGIVAWAFMLCIAWFGYGNGWWPIAFPIVFTIIIGLSLLAAIALIIIAVVTES